MAQSVLDRGWEGVTDELLLRAMEMLDEHPPPALDARQEQAVALLAKGFKLEGVAA